MKNPTKFIFAIVCFAALLFNNKANAQQSYTTVNGWNAYVHLPANYATSGISYPTIIFFPGIGEIGTDANRVIAIGPGAYLSQGWNGNVSVSGTTVEFIVISLQPSSGFPNEYLMNQAIQNIKSRYRVHPNKLYLTGLSHGGWCSSTFVSGDPYGGPYNYASQIAAVVTVQGMRPDDNSPYPNLFDNYANAGGRYLGFEQTLDGRDTKTVVDRMNATRANSGIYVSTNFGGGGHCCWEEYYGGGGKQPGNFMLDGISQNIYQWMARQTLGGTVPSPPPANTPPVSDAGSDKTITLPENSTSLNGSGTDANGSISSYKWTQSSGPSSSSISNSTSANATVSSLVQGTYLFDLLVTDNLGATATDRMQVTVNPSGPPPNQLPSANAGSDKSVPLPVNNVSIAGSGSDPDGTISGYLWSKVSGPSSGSISNATSSTATLSGLVQGVYQYQLKVTDNKGATATDNMQVAVNQPVPPGSKMVKVNLYNGTTPFNDPQWNNWKAVSKTKSISFLYQDGSASTIKAELSSSPLLVDNGGSYASGATGVPQGVLRYNSAATSNRTLTVSGLNTAQKYSFEFYASRSSYSGNKTVYSIGNLKDTINTANNLNDIAKFINITPDNAGKIVIKLSRAGIWHYIAGFTVSEGSVASGIAAIEPTTAITESLSAFPVTTQTPESISDETNSNVKVFPNPFVNTIQVELGAEIKGKYTINLIDGSGKILLSKSGEKINLSKRESLQAAQLLYGIYFLEIISNERRSVHKLKKILSTQY